ncbi:alternate-type signal peptide domain-containing protein [Aeromicrobium piscarium]|uniref:Alternate-type signal peptide domain-containing protein n=1 Tax=Aeromicrobium piscarium TaxID=2590901 RepID=A0A554RNK4_9ACTN|nr:alternate-type signal peptide domain-containing protein [Aeromicrobium piscarium]TSD55698.1 alternate-type signal peptide domain-containing protein [Aeromicrobium piscarium]
MRKTTKGALAAGAAAALLIGGAGTLAYWTAEDSADGGPVASGNLTLASNDDCDTWVYAAGSASAGETVTAFVPGDVVTTTCSFAVGATGDNLAATVDVPDSLEFTVPADAASFAADVDASFTLGGAALADDATITEDNDGDVLAATFLVEFPYGDATAVNVDDMQDITATLDTLTVTLTQVDPNP